MTLTKYQRRHLKHGQPYTSIRPGVDYKEVETEVDGKKVKGLSPTQGFFITGYTLEMKLQPDKGDDPEWADEWEEHDLGHESDLGKAYAKAHAWRESLRDVYPIG